MQAELGALAVDQDVNLTKGFDHTIHQGLISEGLDMSLEK
jgi:hypothetical protein